tara:strand:+ start:544 stop:1515 length:972 start_codon:yes stop_codon:yes gene_type:complete
VLKKLQKSKNKKMKGVQGNQAAQVRMFAHDAIPVAIGAINPDNGITIDSGGYGYAVGNEITLNTPSSGAAAKLKVTSVGKQDIINVQAQSGQQFYLNGRQLGTDKLVLLRGKTYTFYQKASSNNTHILEFSSTNPNTSITSYTTGVDPTGTPGTTGVVTFTVASNAPDDLWYYCTAHANMQGQIEIKDSGDDFFDTYPNNTAVKSFEIIRQTTGTATTKANPFGKAYTVGLKVQPATETYSSPDAFIGNVSNIDLPSTTERGACLYIAEKLSTLKLKTESNFEVTFKNVPSGTFMPVLVKEIIQGVEDDGGADIGDNDVIALY